MFIVREGRIAWSYEHAGKGEISDAVLMSNGNVLFAHQFGVTEIDADKKVVWNFDAPANTEIHTAQPIGSDRVVFIENGDPARSRGNCERAPGRLPAWRWSRCRSLWACRRAVDHARSRRRITPETRSALGAGPLSRRRHRCAHRRAPHRDARVRCRRASRAGRDCGELAGRLPPLPRPCTTGGRAARVDDR